VVLYEEVPMLILSVAIVYFLLEALDGLVVGPLADGHQIVARVRHAVVAGLPWAHALPRDLVEVVLRHTPHLHRGHRVVLIIRPVLLGLLLRTIQIIILIRVHGLMKAS